MIQTAVRVLLVEDDEDDAVLTRHLLREIEGAHFEVEWLSDPDEAQVQLCARRHDVCLADYRLGARDGIEFISEAVGRGCGVPIILLTGQGDHAVDLAAMNAGAADFLHKGQLTASLLERSIRYAIQHKKAEEQRIKLLMERSARAEAEAANRAKDDFLAVLSHELRTPLAAVLMSASALEQEDEIPEKAKELVQIIKRNVDLEARLIDDLLDLTRVERGKLELRREIVDLHEQVRDAVETCCAADISQKRLHVHVHTAAARHHVWGDPARLQQVLWNLIKNAVKFTPPGGRIDVTTSNEADERVRVEVRDSGIGIKPDALPKIFNAFEQADRSITRRFGGLGLGLAICRALVELHGGAIRAHSEGEHRGATFTVEFRTAEPAAQAAPAADSGPRVTFGDHRAVSILLVEDHRDTAWAMQRLLHQRGYAISTANTMAEALATADRGPFDVVISDIGLPDGSGLELMRQLMSKRPIRGIALSGFGKDEDIERSRAAGFSEHLTKPIDIKQLEAAIVRLTKKTAVTAQPA